MKVALHLILFLFLYDYSHGNEKFKEFTKSNSTVDFYWFVFADVSSCEVCMRTIDDLYDYYNASFNFQYNIFMSGVTDIDDVKYKYKSDYNIIADPFNLYINKFNFPTKPYAYLTNSKGEILFEFKPGKERYDSDSLFSLLKSSHQKKIKNQNIKILKEVENDKTFTFVKDLDLSYLNGKIAFANGKSKEIYIIKENSGAIEHKIKLTDYTNKSIFSIYRICFIDDSTIIGIFHSDRSLRNIFTFDFNNNTFTDLDFPYDIFKNNFYEIGFKTYYDSGYFYATHYKRNTKTFFKDSSSIIRFDIKTKEIQTFGNFNTEFCEIENANILFNSTFYFDSDYIYQFQQMTNTLNKIKKKDKSLELMEFQPDKRHYKNFSRNFKWFDNHKKQYYAYKNEVSFLESTIKGRDSNEIALVYYKLIYDDKSLSSYNHYYYVHLLDKNTGRNNTKFDVELPINTIPYKIQDDKMYSIKIENNRFYLVESVID